MRFSRQSFVVLLGRIIVFAGIAAFFWAPMILFYRARAALWGGLWWHRIDWLLIGVFFFMTSVCVFTIDVRKNSLIVLIAALGGLCIEGWGTQTNIWHYYTRERPPLWIIPAWATAGLTVDAIARMTAPRLFQRIPRHWFVVAAWLSFGIFLMLMVSFVWRYFAYPTTIAACAVVVFVVASVLRGTCDVRTAVLVFILGTVLGWFLERWGTTRHCWIYYTRQTPPLFAVAAHGMASVAFWRTHLIADAVIRHFFPSYRGHWSSAIADVSPQEGRRQ